MKSENIVSSFKSTDTFPVDSSMFPEVLFDPIRECLSNSSPPKMANPISPINRIIDELNITSDISNIALLSSYVMENNDFTLDETCPNYPIYIE